MVNRSTGQPQLEAHISSLPLKDRACSDAVARRVSAGVMHVEHKDSLTLTAGCSMEDATVGIEISMRS